MPETPIKKKKPLIMWTPPIKRVLEALMPIMLFSIYLFGWRAFVLLLVVNIFGFLTEYIYTKVYKESVSSAVFVTNCLFALIIPATLPFWMAVVGIVIAVLFGKMVFGGFGRNVFNPALVGRAFIYISFGFFMTGKTAWRDPAISFPGGLAEWIPDAISSATPLKAVSGSFSIADLFWGLTPGSMGETSAFLIILGAIYLIWKKAASWRIIVSAVMGMIILEAVLWFFHVPRSVDPLTALLTGGCLFGIVFMATDPISAAQTNEGKWIYGALIGILTVLIRTFSAWPEGAMFAILLGNVFAPTVDYVVNQLKAKPKAKGAAV